MKQNYPKELKDPRWQRRRLEILERDEFTCQFCGSTTNPLVVHHLSYSGKPWESHESQLVTWCEDCHNEEHKNQYNSFKNLTQSLKSAGFTHDHLNFLSFQLDSMLISADDMVILLMHILRINGPYIDIVNDAREAMHKELKLNSFFTDSKVINRFIREFTPENKYIPYGQTP